MNKLVSLVHSGDKNAWVWPYWKHYYNQYWNNDLIPTIFVSEEIDMDHPHQFVMNMKTGANLNWSEGLIKILNKIGYEYILYWHEDHWPVGKVDFECLSMLCELMDKNKNINLIKCCGEDAGWKNAPKTLQKSEFEVKSEPLWKYWMYEDYIVSHQPSIWRKDFLLSTIDPTENNWDHELKGTQRLKGKDSGVYAYLGGSLPPDSYPIPYIESIMRGKVYPGMKEYFNVK